MNNFLIVGNWKMNGSMELVKKFMDFSFDRLWHLAVPSPYITYFKSHKMIQPGAQDFHHRECGAYTGDVSVSMILEMGAKFSIIGHSERRNLSGETNEMIKEKLLLGTGLLDKIILCVGENKADRDSGREYNVVNQQLGILDQLESMENIIIAYEPVWAIGTGTVATPKQADDMHSFIKKYLKEKFGNVVVLYGGSVNPSNANELSGMQNIDGFLIGGASQDPEKIQKILKDTGER